MSRTATFLTMCIAAVLLMGPALINGSPFIFYDTSHYLELGRAILNHAPGHAAPELITTSNPAAAVFEPAASASSPERDHAALSYAGGRSPYYSAFLFSLVRFGGLWAAAAAQAFVCAVLIHLGVRSVRLPRPALTTLVIAAGLGALTTAGFYAAMLMPDIFVAIGLLCLGLLVLCPSRPAPLRTSILLVMGAAAVAMHATNAPVLAAAALGFACVMGLAYGPRVVADRRAWILGFGLIASGMAAGLGFNLASQVLLHDTPRSPPYLTARVLADGYGRDYLAQACRNPDAYALCAYQNRRFATQDEFLWSADPTRGVFTAVSSGERRRLQREQSRFVAGAVLSHPLEALSYSTAHVISQLASLGVASDFGQVALSWRTMAFRQVIPQAAPTIEESLAYRQHFPFAAADALALVTLLVSLAAFAWRLSRPQVRAALAGERLSQTPTPLGVLAALVVSLLITVIFNAAITGVLSGVNARYEARLIWLLPYTIALFLISSVAAGRDTERPGKALAIA